MIEQTDIPTDEEIAEELIAAGALQELREDVICRAVNDIRNLPIHVRVSESWQRDQFVDAMTAERWIYGTDCGQERWMRFGNVCDEHGARPWVIQNSTRRMFITVRKEKGERWLQEKRR